MVDGPPLTGLTAAMAVFANMLGSSMNKPTESITDENACSLNFTRALSIFLSAFFTPKMASHFAYVSHFLDASMLYLQRLVGLLFGTTFYDQFHVFTSSNVKIQAHLFIQA